MTFIWLYFCVMCFVFGYHISDMRNWKDFWWLADVAFWPFAGVLILIEKVRE